VVGIAHGYRFMVYLLLTFDLAGRAGWRLTRVALVGLAGTVPFLSFVAERAVTKRVKDGRL
jgi:integral membrane protein